LLPRLIPLCKQIRVPDGGSQHPETLNKAEILRDLHNYCDLVPEHFEKLENDIKINIYDKQNHINVKDLSLKNYKNKSKGMGRGVLDTLYNLYNDLLTLRVNDGRDRVLLMLYTIANTLKIDPEQFSKDLYQWATANNWKEYRWRRWIDYYREGRYVSTWGKNWRWAIKNFLDSKDIEKDSYDTIKAILEPYLNKLKIKKSDNDN